jgi:hypothetical protein
MMIVVHGKIDCFKRLKKEEKKLTFSLVISKYKAINDQVASRIINSKKSHKGRKLFFAIINNLILLKI